MLNQAKQFIETNRFPIACYLATTALVLFATWFGLDYLAYADPTHPPHDQKYDLAHRWDSRWYLQIAEDGYQYTGEDQENVAFFPLYPALIAMITKLGIPLGLNGFLVSHASFFAALIVFWAYLRSRFPESESIQKWSLLATVVFPFGFYFRFVYTESLFLLTTITAMYLMERRRSLLLICLLYTSDAADE